MTFVAMVVGLLLSSGDGLAKKRRKKQKNPEDFIEEITPQGPKPDLDPDVAPVERIDPEPAPEPATAPPTEPDERADPAKPVEPGAPASAVKGAAGPDAGPKARRPPPAQPKPKPTAKPLAALDDKPAKTVAADAAIEIRQLSYAGLVERWDARRAAQKAGDESRRKRAETVFADGMAELGLHGLEGLAQAPDIGIALALEAREVAAQGDRARATARIDLAKKAAPDAPGIRWTEVAIELEVGTFFGAVEAVSAGLASTWRSPDHLAAVAARLVAVVSLVLLLLLFVSSILIVIKVFRYLAFDLWAALPRGAAQWQVRTLLALVLLVPFIAGAGPVFTALLWFTLGWLYLERREQVAFAAVGVALISLPLLIGLGARLFSYQGSETDRAYRAVDDVAAEELRAKYAAQPAQGLPFPAEVALAEAAFREGRLDEAVDRWRRVLQQRPEEAWVHNNVGVLAAVGGNEDLAVAAFRDALGRDPGHVVAAFNTTLLELRNPRKHKTEKAVKELLADSMHRLTELRGITYRRPEQVVSQNRAFVWSPMPRRLLPDLWEAPPKAASSFEAEMARLLYFGLRPYAAMGAIGGFLLVWFILGRLRRRLLPSRPCRRCGSPASRRYDGPDVPEQSCSACFHAFELSGGQQEAGVRANKERQIAAHERARGRAAIALSVVFAGAGHMFLGAVARGLLYAVGFALAASTALAIAIDVVPWPSPLTAEVGWLLWGPPALAALIIYIASIQGASNAQADLRRGAY